MVELAAKRVRILALPQTSMMTLASVLDPLRAANRLAKHTVYDWQLVSFDGDDIELSCGIKIASHKPLSKHSRGEMLVVIAGFNHQRWLKTNYMVTLQSAAKRFNTICAVEAGTWLLAHANIAKQHRVTTHWEDLDQLAEAFPKLQVRRDRFTIDRSIWSSGGASPSLDMMLHYIGISHSRSLALDVANVFIYDDSHAPSEAQSLSALAKLSADEPRVSEAVAIMQANLEEPLAIHEINELMGVSSKTLETQFRRHLNITPKAYYQRLRLQAARKSVLDSKLEMTQIALRFGFSSPANFSRAFKRQFGVAPSVLRHSR